MFPEMRRKDRELSDKMTEKILEDGEYGILSMIGENGYPYGVPLNYIYYKGNIYFHGANEGYKLKNLQHNSKVSFNVVVDVEVKPDQFSTNYKSAIAFGTAREIEGEQKEDVLYRILERFSPDYPEEGEAYYNNTEDATTVVEIKIDHLTGKGRDL